MPIVIGRPYYGGYRERVVQVPVPVVVTPAAAISEVPAEPQLTEVRSGATLMLSDKAIVGSEGAVVLQVDKLMFPAKVGKWEAGRVTFTLPELPLAEATRAEILMATADGTVLAGQPVMLLPAVK